MTNGKFKKQLQEHITQELSKYTALLPDAEDQERYNILDAVTWGMAITDVVQLPRTVLKMSRNAFQAYMFRTHIPAAT